MDLIISCWKNSNRMPIILRMLCQGGMVVTPISFISLLIPQECSVNGHIISYVEFWSSGAGVVATALTALVGVGTWGLAACNPNSRWALVLAPTLPCFITVAFPSSYLFSSWQNFSQLILNGVITSLIIYVCLFHIKSVQEYLKSSGVSEH